MGAITSGLIAAGVGAAGAIAGSAINSAAAGSNQDKANKAAAEAAAQAQANGQAAINSPAAQQAAQQQQQQAAYAQQLAQSGNGAQNLQNAYAQIQGVANGTGPNPALAQLQQQTGQNIAAQSALMAGQRGAGANAGLIARQAAQQGASTQQNSIGQAATLQAQQQLAAMGQLGGIANSQVGNQQTALNSAANSAMGNQANTTAALTGASQQGTSLANNAISGQNATNQQSNNYNQGLVNGAFNGIGAVASTLGSSSGQGLATPTLGSNYTNNNFKLPGSYAQGGPVSALGQHLKMAKGGKVPALVSPGERYLSPKEVDKVVAGKKAPMKAGEKIPGKPVVGGAKNDYANDTVHKTLQEGGVVLPRSVTQGKDADKKSRAFIAEILAKKGKKVAKK